MKKLFFFLGIQALVLIFLYWKIGHEFTKENYQAFLSWKWWMVAFAWIVLSLVFIVNYLFIKLGTIDAIADRYETYMQAEQKSQRERLDKLIRENEEGLESLRETRQKYQHEAEKKYIELQQERNDLERQQIKDKKEIELLNKRLFKAVKTAQRRKRKLEEIHGGKIQPGPGKPKTAGSGKRKKDNLKITKEKPLKLSR